MTPRLILDPDHFSLTLKRLSYQLIENHDAFDNTVLVGLQPRGVNLSRCLRDELNRLIDKDIVYGELDVTFFRDDFRLRSLVPSATSMDFTVEGKNVILVDDVLYTGRSIRAGLDAIQHFGRPLKVELLVLVDRRFSRHVPIQPDYVGITVDAPFSEKVILNWKEDNSSAGITLVKEDAS